MSFELNNDKQKRYKCETNSCRNKDKITWLPQDLDQAPKCASCNTSCILIPNYADYIDKKLDIKK